MTQAERQLRAKFELMKPSLSEAGRRRWAGVEAQSLGRGGVSLVSRATGLSRTTVYAGLRTLKDMPCKNLERQGRSRRAGAGRPRLTSKDAGLLRALNALVDPATRGDPISPLRWTCKSTARLAGELSSQGHRVSPRSVAALLRADGYSLQVVRKTREGSGHPDRDAQFRHLNARVARFIKTGDPVISVDAKKKELVGDFQNKGAEWQPKGQPQEVRVHDFEDEQLGKVAPYGVYDLAANQGWVSVGVDHDTSAFAVATIRRWWKQMGRPLYPHARRLLITADSGGSNGSRVRLWKLELQKLADDLALRIEVCHFPPGTSKWNKIEHRMFCHITQNWRGRPLESQSVIVKLIGATTTKEGLKVKAALDKALYPKGIKVNDAQMSAVRLKPNPFHGDWNYTITPHP